MRWNHQVKTWETPSPSCPRGGPCGPQSWEVLGWQGQKFVIMRIEQVSKYTESDGSQTSDYQFTKMETGKTRINPVVLDWKYLIKHMTFKICRQTSKYSCVCTHISVICTHTSIYKLYPLERPKSNDTPVASLYLDFWILFSINRYQGSTEKWLIWGLG